MLGCIDLGDYIRLHVDDLECRLARVAAEGARAVGAFEVGWLSERREEAATREKQAKRPSARYSASGEWVLSN
jgi:hypothetical protein